MDGWMLDDIAFSMALGTKIMGLTIFFCYGSLA